MQLGEDVEIDVSSGKITRDAFVFMKARKPIPQSAYCVSCAFFIAGKQRCENFGPGNVVRAQGSCGVYGFGPGQANGSTPKCRITPTEAGYVEHPVHCVHCRFFDPIDEPQTHCDLFTQLQLMQPNVWDLDRYVDSEDCCNANTEGDRDPTIFGPLGPIPHANVLASDADIEVDCAVPNSSRLAMDRGARSKDVNGWLHVKDCRISKANVCPYMGKEIPGFEDLGLQADKVYYLYRDASALRAAAGSFERAPLVIVHKGVTADQPNKHIIIGAISNVRWQAPYLVADLTVWDGMGIEAIESGRQEELSPGYHYRPDMTPGTHEGERFDGRMMDVTANHLCIVDVGRTGPDVIVNDAALASRESI